MVVDIRMPGMSGFALRDALAAQGHDIPTVFITGHGSEEIREQAQEHGAVDILYKPFEESALLDAFGRALERLTRTGASDGRSLCPRPPRGLH